MNRGTETSDPPPPERLAKAIARSGLCSRREAERWIEQGRVSVNGDKATTPAINVTSADRITVDGKPLPERAPARLWRYHKLQGLVTSHRDPQGRPTVFEKLPKEIGRVISVGRLDINTEGLLLLTNDGALARHLELPATGWTRRYRVRAFGDIGQEQLDTLTDGIEIDGIRYGPIEIRIERRTAHHLWLQVSLREGKNREVKRVLEHLGLKVGRLIRVSFGPFQLGDLKPGAIVEVPAKVLAEQTGQAPSGKRAAKPKPKKKSHAHHRRRS